MKLLLIWAHELIIRLAWFSIARSSSFVNEAKWVISRCAISEVFFAPFCQTWGPNTFLHEANIMWVPVWWAWSYFLLSSSIVTLTFLPLSLSILISIGRSRVWRTHLPTLTASTILKALSTPSIVRAPVSCYWPPEVG